MSWSKTLNYGLFGFSCGFANPLPPIVGRFPELRVAVRFPPTHDSFWSKVQTLSSEAGSVAPRMAKFLLEILCLVLTAAPGSASRRMSL